MKKRYKLLLAGVSFVAVSATLGIETSVFAYKVAGGVLAIIIANASLRFVVVKTALHFGIAHPLLESHWPRVPWRIFQRVHKAIIEKYEELFVMGKRSSSGFTPTLSTLLLKYSPDKIILGRARVWGWPWVQYVAEPISRHMMIFGQTGGGKSNYLASIIAFTPLTASIFLIDPKGFFSRTILAAKRAMGAAVYVIDVLGNTGIPSASINPIRTIFELNELTGKDYTTIMVVGICQALIPKEKFEKPFFHRKAIEIVAAMILHEITQDPDTDLVQICRRVFAGYADEAEELGDGEKMHLKAMAENPAFDGFISLIANRALSTDPKTLSNIMATATAPLMWLMHKQTKEFVIRHDVSLLSLKSNTRKVIISLACSPFELRTTFAGYFRMMIFIVLKIMELIPEKIEERTRIIFEEMGTIGAVEGLPEVWPLLRGYGGFGIGVVQEIEGLQRPYPDHWRTIMGNSDATVYFQTEDPQTLDHISKNVLGKKTLDYSTRAVLEPEQCKRFLSYTKGRGGNCIVARAGKRPLALKMVEYFRDCPVWLYEPDSEHDEPAGRAYGRSLLKSSTSLSSPIPQPPLLSDQSKFDALIRSARPSGHQTH